MKHTILALTCATASLMMSAAGTPAYLDESLPLEQRVEDALSRMTLDEQIAMCHAEGKFAAAGVPRRGNPHLGTRDAPHG